MPARPATLDDVLAAVKALEAKVDAQQQAQPATDTDAELVRAIFAAMQGKAFPTWQLVDFATDTSLQQNRLRAAIQAAVGSLSGIRIGKALKRLEGEDFDGLVLVRVGEDRGSASWEVRELRAQLPFTGSGRE